MNKKTTILKGFDKLLTPSEPAIDTSKSTEVLASESLDVNTSTEISVKEKPSKPKSSAVKSSKRKSVSTSKRNNVQTSGSTNGSTSNSKQLPKSIELKKCTLYLPENLMDSLAIMKVRKKRDLSELAAEAITDYLSKHKFLNA